MSTELQQLNEQNKAGLWAERIAMRIQTGGIMAEIHNGADPATVESVLRILKLC